MKILIVTPDLIGPIKNGGIGTFVTEISEVWGKDHDVNILFTGAVEVDQKNWLESYSSRGIRVEILKPEKLNPGEPWFIGRSRHIVDSYNLSVFDLVIFQDWHGNGYEAIRRKAFNPEGFPKIFVVVHSPDRWQRDSNGVNHSNYAGDIHQDFVEQFCIQFADEVIFPSKAMAAWVNQQGWKPKGNIQIGVGYPVSIDDTPNKAQSIKPTSVAFYGRLERRKGLRYFLDEIEKYLTRHPDAIDEIKFVGKHGWLDNVTSDKAISEFTTRLSGISKTTHIKVVSDATRDQALKEVSSGRYLIFTPSLQDNLPFATIELASLGLNVFGSEIGGIPEILPNERLFRIRPWEIVRVLEKNLGTHVEVFKLDSSRWNSFWRELPSSIDKNLTRDSSTSLRYRCICTCKSCENCGERTYKVRAHLAPEIMLSDNPGSSWTTEFVPTLAFIPALAGNGHILIQSGSKIPSQLASNVAEEPLWLAANERALILRSKPDLSLPLCERVSSISSHLEAFSQLRNADSISKDFVRAFLTIGIPKNKKIYWRIEAFLMPRGSKKRSFAKKLAKKFKLIP